MANLLREAVINGTLIQDHPKYPEVQKENAGEPESAGWVALGEVYMLLRDFTSAIQVYERVTKMESSKSREWERLGDAYSEQSLIHKAVETYKKALGKHATESLAWTTLRIPYTSKWGDVVVCGYEHSAEQSVGLGNKFSESKEKLDIAMKMTAAIQQKLLKASEIHAGQEHLDTLSILHNLAATYWVLGRLKEAETIQNKVLESRTRILRIDHPQTLITMNNLAATYWATGRTMEAAKEQDKVLQASVRTFEVGDPTLSIFNKAAETYRSYNTKGRRDLTPHPQNPPDTIVPVPRLRGLGPRPRNVDVPVPEEGDRIPLVGFTSNTDTTTQIAPRPNPELLPVSERPLSVLSPMSSLTDEERNRHSIISSHSNTDTIIPVTLRPNSEQLPISEEEPVMPQPRSSDSVEQENHNFIASPESNTDTTIQVTQCQDSNSESIIASKPFLLIISLAFCYFCYYLFS